MFVTVFLVKPRYHTVIPHQFVYKLNEMNSWNHGINPYQGRRIYFSSELFNALSNRDAVNENDYVPNFGLEESENYPLPDGMLETCFHARLIKFWGEFSYHRNNFSFSRIYSSTIKYF